MSVAFAVAGDSVRVWVVAAASVTLVPGRIARVGTAKAPPASGRRHDQPQALLDRGEGSAGGEILGQIGDDGVWIRGHEPTVKVPTTLPAPPVGLSVTFHVSPTRTAPVKVNVRRLSPGRSSRGWLPQP